MIYRIICKYILYIAIYFVDHIQLLIVYSTYSCFYKKNYDNIENRKRKNNIHNFHYNTQFAGFTSSTYSCLHIFWSCNYELIWPSFCFIQLTLYHVIFMLLHNVYNEYFSNCIIFHWLALTFFQPFPSC